MLTRLLLNLAVAFACMVPHSRAARALSAQSGMDRLDMPRPMAPAPGPEPAANSNVTCPPPGFGPVERFNVTEYISATWFVLAQTPLLYQPESQLYCTRANYVPLDPADPLAGLQVINYSNRDEVNGPPVSTGMGPTLLARVPDRSRPSALSVGFDFPGASQLIGTQAGAGPYWVVATGDNAAGGYDWAIVSGGAPGVATEMGCRAEQPATSGLWLFSRGPEDRDALDMMLAVLEEAGVDTSVLVMVPQEDCLYQGAL